VLWNFISGLASRFPRLFSGLRFGPKGLEDEFYRSLYDAFRNACLDYKNLMAVDWDACFTCTCTFKEMGPCQIIYDNACNLINWVSHIHTYCNPIVHNVNTSHAPHECTKSRLPWQHISEFIFAIYCCVLVKIIPSTIFSCGAHRCVYI